MMEYKIESKPASYFETIVVALALGIGLLAIAVIFSPRALADAARTNALTPGEVTRQSNQITDEQEVLAATQAARIAAQQASQTAWAQAWRAGGISLVVLIAVVAMHSAFRIHIQERTRARAALSAANLKEVRNQKEAENPVHTPVGPYLSEYTQGGAVYSKCHVTGITVRADDARGMAILAKLRAPIIERLLMTMIAAQRDMTIAQMAAGQAERRGKVEVIT